MSRRTHAPPDQHSVADASVRLHDEHHHETAVIQHALDRLTAVAASPRVLLVLVVLVSVWLATNLALQHLGLRAPDPPPFAGLDLAATLAALLVACLILSTQRRRDQLAQHRDEMSLELTILADRKLSKLIELAETLRRDDPHLVDRIDTEAAGMARPANPYSLLSAVKDFGRTRRTRAWSSRRRRHTTADRSAK